MRKSHKERMQQAKDYLDEENNALSGAKKSRNIGKTKDGVDKQLKSDEGWGLCEL